MTQDSDKIMAELLLANQELAETNKEMDKRLQNPDRWTNFLIFGTPIE